MKMYYFYGIMSSSKTAVALMKKFNFEYNGKKVLLVKPKIDTRDGETVIKSRIGLQSEVLTLGPKDLLMAKVACLEKYDVIITDESQFFTVAQIDELRLLADECAIVMCFGLKTDFTSHLFEASKRLLEVADCIREIPAPCKCGKKAILNAKAINGEIIYSGKQIDLGGNDKYIGLCHKCWSSGKLN